MPSDNRLTMSIPEVAVALGIGRTLAHRLARDDAFPRPIRVIHLGRRRVVARAAVEAAIAVEPRTTSLAGGER